MRKCLLFLFMYLLLSAPVLAEPAGADLLKACEQAVKNDFEGAKGKLCLWYVTPCDCPLGKNPTLPRVCLPESVSDWQLALEVVAGFAAQPRLQEESATAAVALILSKSYPCPDG